MDEELQRLPIVQVRTGLSRSSIYLKISKGEFPTPVKIGDRAVGWPRSVIDAWIEERIKADHAGRQK